MALMHRKGFHALDGAVLDSVYFGWVTSCWRLQRRSFTHNYYTGQQRSNLWCWFGLILLKYSTSLNTCPCTYVCSTVWVSASRGGVCFDCVHVKTPFPPFECLCAQLIFPRLFQLRSRARRGGSAPSWCFPLNTMSCRWRVTTHTGTGNAHLCVQAAI